MLLSEKEAQQRVCPIMRPDLLQSPSDMDADIVRERVVRDRRCLASGCMVWRYAGSRKGPIVERVRAQPLSTRPEGFTGYQAIDGMTGDWVRQEEFQVGYCGLAGNPETS